MSGEHHSVQKLLKDMVPWAIYIHCYSHQLNLVVVHLIKKNLIASKFVDLLGHLYNYFSSSNIHNEFTSVQQECFGVLESQVVELKRVSDLTRWSCIVDAIKSCSNSFNAINLTLHRVARKYPDRAQEARDLLAKMNFEFIFCLNFFNKIFTMLSIPVKYLQSKNINLVSAMEVIKSFVRGKIEFLKLYFMPF